MTVSGVLEPKLTAYDKRVLKALPIDWHEDPEKREPAIDIWELGRKLDTLALEELARVLRGMEYFGLVIKSWGTGRRPDTWRRSAKGSEAIA